MNNSYIINHSYKPAILVPLLAISNNFDFLTNENRYNIKAIMQDGTPVIIDRWEYMNILSEKTDNIIREIYGIDVLSFARKWYRSLPIDSLNFIYMQLSKEVDNECR